MAEGDSGVPELRYGFIIRGGSAELQAMEVMYQLMAGHSPIVLDHEAKVRACRWILALVEAEPHVSPEEN